MLMDPAWTYSTYFFVQGIPLGFDYFLKLNPEFLLQVIEEYLIFAPNEVKFR